VVCRLENGDREVVCLHAVVFLCIPLVSHGLSSHVKVALLLCGRVVFLNHMCNAESETQHCHEMTKKEKSPHHYSPWGMSKEQAAGKQTLHMVFAYRSVFARRSITGKFSEQRPTTSCEAFLDTAGGLVGRQVTGG
jgi:hypothetical protein